MPERGGENMHLKFFWPVDGKTITCSVWRREEDVNVALLFSTRETGFELVHVSLHQKHPYGERGEKW